MSTFTEVESIEKFDLKEVLSLITHERVDINLTMNQRGNMKVDPHRLKEPFLKVTLFTIFYLKSV